MMSIEDLIQFENENTKLDFKLKQYKKEQYPSLLKDIISMANAYVSESRFVIIGLKPNNTDRNLVGITDELTDSATFQQLVYENIEPEIAIDYYPYIFDGLTFGIFEIKDCNNPPYLMKKDYGNGKNSLKRGDGFVRKGTHQTRLIRSDYDLFNKNNSESSYFKEDVSVTFSNTDSLDRIVLEKATEIELPSTIQRKKIESIIAKKQKGIDDLVRLSGGNLDATYFAPMIANITGRPIPYEQRTIKVLMENIKYIEETYRDEDYYAVYEQNSNKINLIMKNLGLDYIEDATIRLTIPNLKNVLVASEVYHNPANASFKGADLVNMNYPNVEKDSDFYYITNNIGDIKHYLEHKAFEEDIRIKISKKIKVKSLELKCELFAKNIKDRITKILTIDVGK